MPMQKLEAFKHTPDVGTYSRNEGIKSETLKPCPLCGSSRLRVEGSEFTTKHIQLKKKKREFTTRNAMYMIACQECGIQLIGYESDKSLDFEKETICTKWNRRPNSSTDNT